jgi:hypothetical protein
MQWCERCTNCHVDELAETRDDGIRRLRHYPGDALTIEQFLDHAILDLQVFIESYKQHAEADPDVYEPSHDIDRWWQEFKAYQSVVVLQDRLRGD